MTLSKPKPQRSCSDCNSRCQKQDQEQLGKVSEDVTEKLRTNSDIRGETVRMNETHFTDEKTETQEV